MLDRDKGWELGWVTSGVSSSIQDRSICGGEGTAEAHTDVGWWESHIHSFVHG